MTGLLNYRGLASPDGNSAKSSDWVDGSVVRSRLAGACVGIALSRRPAQTASHALRCFMIGEAEYTGRQAAYRTS